MVFSSNLFLFLFLPFTLAGHLLAPKRLKNIFLLIMSLIFYGWGEPKIVFVMLLSILMNYIEGLLIDLGRRRHYGKLSMRLILVLVVVSNLGLLFYYKYLDFFITSVNAVSGLQIPLREIALPIGISFFTFQIMSYTLDLYMGQVEVQRNPFDLALYIALFPQLIAGPIVRYIDVNAQIKERQVSAAKFAQGIRRFAVGLAKKVVIANVMGYTVDQIFGQPIGSQTPGVAWLGALSYAMQIYFDFSGYSDMAIGIGKMLGFDFLENFNYPYIAKNMTDFWRRWHISLSTWFRDYLYIPLGGNRRGNQYVNLFIVFLMTGLWHGASWNFIIWGLWHGAFLMLEKPLIKGGLMKKIPGWLGWGIAMLAVLIGWVLFRAETLSDAFHYLGLMFGMVKPQGVAFTFAWYANGRVLTVLALGALASIPWRSVLSRQLGPLEGKGSLALAENAYALVLLLVSVMLCMTSTYNPFIYFRF